MPRLAASGIKGLYKKHNFGCRNVRGKPTACDCPWYGAYRGTTKGLAAWAAKRVDPRTKTAAEAVLRRLKTAVDEKRYSPAGEQQSLGSGQRFTAFVSEWKTHYAEERGLSANSLPAMLNLLTGGLGGFTLEQLAGNPTHIERWLNRMGKERNWSANTWNRYYGLLSTLFVRATRWRSNGVPRMTENPMAAIERRVGTKKKFGVRIEEVTEDRLFAACDELNRPQHSPRSTRLDWERVEAIRQRAAAGEPQVSVATAFGISTGLCCQIVSRQAWNRERVSVGTKGELMRLRLMMALDTGVRREEMMLIQLKHINFRPAQITVDGVLRELLSVEVQSKGEKTTGEPEVVYAGTDRLRDALENRRLALREDPDAYVFGTEDGRHQKDFRRMWRELFTRAGLTYGRDRGVVWHTLRHEFCSRAAENSGDPVVAQELARHRDLRTTQGYLHPRRSRVLAAAALLDRQWRRSSEAEASAGARPAITCMLHDTLR